MINELTRTKAADVFVRAVAKTATASYAGIIDGLDSGIPKDPFEHLSRWYHALLDDDKRYVREIVHVMMDQSVFDLLCLLDGVAGHERIDEKPVHFALRFEMYGDMDKLMADDPEVSIRLNPALEPDHLHDMFGEVMELLDK